MTTFQKLARLLPIAICILLATNVSAAPAPIPQIHCADKISSDSAPTLPTPHNSPRALSSAVLPRDTLGSTPPPDVDPPTTKLNLPDLGGCLAKLEALFNSVLPSLGCMRDPTEERKQKGREVLERARLAGSRVGALAKQMNSGAEVDDDEAVAKIPKYKQDIARILKDLKDLSSSGVFGNVVELLGCDPSRDSDSTHGGIRSIQPRSPPVAGDSLRPQYRSQSTDPAKEPEALSSGPTDGTSNPSPKEGRIQLIRRCFWMALARIRAKSRLSKDSS